MKNFMKPITNKMLRQLKAGRAIELSENGRRICVLEDFNGCLGGLYRRGLVSTKMVMVDGKEIIGVVITQSGIDFLRRCERGEKKLVILKKTG